MEVFFFWNTWHFSSACYNCSLIRAISTCSFSHRMCNRLWNICKGSLIFRATLLVLNSLCKWSTHDILDNFLIELHNFRIRHVLAHIHWSEETCILYKLNTEILPRLRYEAPCYCPQLRSNKTVKANKFDVAWKCDVSCCSSVLDFPNYCKKDFVGEDGS